MCLLRRGQDPVLRMRLSTKNSNAKPFGRWPKCTCPSCTQRKGNSAHFRRLALAMEIAPWTVPSLSRSPNCCYVDMSQFKSNPSHIPLEIRVYVNHLYLRIQMYHTLLYTTHQVSPSNLTWNMLFLLSFVRIHSFIIDSMQCTWETSGLIVAYSTVAYSGSGSRESG